MHSKLEATFQKRNHESTHGRAKQHPRVQKRAGVAAALLMLVVAASSCKNPAEDKPKAEVSQPAVTAAAAPAEGATRYVFGPTDSKIEFVGAKVTGKHDGSFPSFSGTIAVPDGQLDKATFSTEIDVASLVTDDEKLTGHLKSPDFFDVEKFPKARFTTTSLKRSSEPGRTHDVTGNLELHGVTKSVTFPATLDVANDTVKATAEFAINRKDFGIVYAGKSDDLIRDDVVVKLTLNAKKS